MTITGENDVLFFLFIPMENKKARNFRQYPVWQMAVDYATKVYKITAEMPWSEECMPELATAGAFASHGEYAVQRFGEARLFC